MKLSIKAVEAITSATCLLYLLLFVYAAVSKLLDFENFQVQLGQSPLVGPYAALLTWLVPGLELFLSVMLSFTRLRMVALWMGMGLMSLFFGYIIIILIFSPFIPCSCGGILEQLGWKAHLWFNGFFILIAAISVLYNSRQGTKPFRYSKLIAILAVIILGILSNGLLFKYTQSRLETDNPFVRRFPNNPTRYINQKELSVNSYYFAGSFKGFFYLGNYTAPRHILRFSPNLTRTDTIIIKSKVGALANVPLRLIIRDDKFYLYNGKSPVIYSGAITDWTIRDVDKAAPYFYQLQPLGNSQFAFKGNRSITGENIVGLYKKDQIPEIKILDSVIEPFKGGDGFFDTDGMLLSNVKGSKFMYLHRYCNRLTIIDSKGAVLMRSHTIDTVSQPRLSISKQANGQRIQLASPPPYVNRTASAWNQFLFVDASLKGRFEDAVAWRHSSTIDVYDTNRNIYIYSFYIPPHNGKKLHEMWVDDGYVYVLYDTELATYELDKKLNIYMAK
jgi:hypothetical protein